MTTTIPIPDDLNDLLTSLLSETFSIRDPQTHKPIKFLLERGECVYRYFKGAAGEMFCYTPHADIIGYYWVWTYKPIGKGSRSGKARRFKMTHLIRCAKRRTAKERAQARCQKAKERHV